MSQTESTILRGDQAIAWVAEHSRYFTRAELECKCGCGLLVIDTEFLGALNILRRALGRPLTLTSFTRCAAHNAAQGGKPTSDHLVGRGADIAVSKSGVRFKLVSAAVGHGINRIGIGKTFLHLGQNPQNPQDVLWLY